MSTFTDDNRTAYKLELTSLEELPHSGSESPINLVLLDSYRTSGLAK